MSLVLLTVEQSAALENRDIIIEEIYGPAPNSRIGFILGAESPCER
jgi:hypothetical protein